MKLREHLEKIGLELSEIKQDLKYHIKRTDLLEQQISPLLKVYHFIQVSAALLLTGGAVAALIKLFI